MKSTIKSKLIALCLLALSANAYAQSNIVGPPPGSTLTGSADIFEWNRIEGATRYSLWLGTEEDSDAYGRHNTNIAHQGSMQVVRLPLDGSTITATLRWYDGSRWRSQSPASYTAGHPTSGVWGDCTATADWGIRARLLPKNYSETSQNYVPRPGMRASYGNNLVNTMLRDGCASDKDYAVISGIVFHPNKAYKGVYLWLAPGSGAASMEATVRTNRGSYTRTRLIHPYADIAKPIYISIDSVGIWDLEIHPLNSQQPVRVSEIRMASLGDDISSLRKLRLTDSASFVAANGDPRARVTAEIDDLFGPNIFGDDITYANYDTCGTSIWVDATWEIEQGLVTQAWGYNNWHQTVWVNFEKVSNEEISAAIKASIELGVEQNGSAVYGQCTPAPDSLIYQDWVGKAQAAKADTYEGPQLHTGKFGNCKQTDDGRAFNFVRASKTDDSQYAPSNLIDSCTNVENSWSGNSGTSVTLDAGKSRAMKGIYLWSTFAREETLTIESSLDGVTWRSEWSPAVTKKVYGPVFYPLISRTSRYIRITGNGSWLNSWTNLTEARWVHRNDTVMGN